MAGIWGCSLLRAPELCPPPCTQDSARLPPLYQNQAASSVSEAMTYQEQASLCIRGWALLCIRDCATLPSLYEGCVPYVLRSACCAAACCLPTRAYQHTC